MKTSTLFNRFAASFVVLSAVSIATPAMATTASNAQPAKVAVASKTAKAGQQVQTKRAKLPKAWTWQKKAVKLDGIFAKR
ncbi:MAG: hypothetical protein AAFV29_10130 [Myxococcota bacterium]